MISIFELNAAVRSECNCLALGLLLSFLSGPLWATKSTEDKPNFKAASKTRRERSSRFASEDPSSTSDEIPGLCPFSSSFLPFRFLLFSQSVPEQPVPACRTLFDRDYSGAPRQKSRRPTSHYEPPTMNETFAYQMSNGHPPAPLPRRGPIEGPNGRRLIRRITWRSSTYKLMASLWVLGVLYIIWLVRDLFYLPFTPGPSRAANE